MEIEGFTSPVLIVLKGGWGVWEAGLRKKVLFILTVTDGPKFIV
jgi:hypothetical protein